MNARIVALIGLVVAIFVLGFLLVRDSRTVNAASAGPAITDVSYGPAYKARTELCVKPDGEAVRNWIFNDRWVKNQLSYDTYTVDGRVYNALRIVTDDAKLPRGTVRFRKVVVNIGDGPSLEGHSYLRTLVNGSQVKMERELLFVEFNGKLGRQRRPLPECGEPRR